MQYINITHCWNIFWNKCASIFFSVLPRGASDNAGRGRPGHLSRRKGSQVAGLPPRLRAAGGGALGVPGRRRPPHGLRVRPRVLQVRPRRRLRRRQEGADAEAVP